MRQIWQAFDGTCFEEMDDCVEYEKILDLRDELFSALLKVFPQRPEAMLQTVAKEISELPYNRTDILTRALVEINRYKYDRRIPGE